MIKLFFLLLILLLLMLLLANSWRQTTQGRLALWPAILLRLSPKTNRQNWSVEEQRAWMRRMTRMVGGRRVAIPEVRNLSLELEGRRIDARLYRPKTEGTLPLVIYYHGGGFRVGDLDSHDNICRRLAKASSMAILAIDYRRTPEHRFPAAAEDAYGALVWASKHAASLGIDPSRMAVAGDSAGGNLAAAVCLRARNEKGTALRCQILIYPLIDFHNLRRPSHLKFAEGFLLTLAAIQSYTDDYLPDPEKRKLPLASPFHADSHANLPPAFILTAAFDPLLDEGKAYAEKLEKAGVNVRYHCFEGMIHGFFGLPLFGPQGKKAVQEVAAFLKLKMEN